MSNRRKFLRSSFLSSFGLLVGRKLSAGAPYPRLSGNPVVISTWDTGLAANAGAWKILGSNGRALDAVEAGVRVTEDEINCCVGLGATWARAEADIKAKTSRAVVHGPRMGSSSRPPVSQFFRHRSPRRADAGLWSDRRTAVEDAGVTYTGHATDYSELERGGPSRSGLSWSAPAPDDSPLLPAGDPELHAGAEQA